MTTANFSQVGVEAWLSVSPAAKISQIGVEAWLSVNPAVRMSQVGIEVWRSTVDTGTLMAVSQIGLEVWEFIPYVPLQLSNVVIIFMGG